MKRSLKNFIMITLCLVFCGVIYYTMSLANKSVVNSREKISEMNAGRGFGAPPGEKNSDFSDGKSNDESSINKQSNDDSTNDEDAFSSDDNGSLEKSNGDGQPPERPDDKSFDGEMMSDSSIQNMDTIYYILLGVESFVISVILIYLFMSSFNKKTFKETFPNKDRLLICLLISVILTGGSLYGEGYLVQNAFNNGQKVIASNENVKASGVKVVDGAETLAGSYESTDSDQSVILIQDGGNATIKGAEIIKSSGDSSNTENSDFYGINAGILTQKSSKAVISNATIKTNAKGSNAVFATGEGSEIEINDSKITTTGSSSSRGLDATYGGAIKADNVTIKTSGASSAALATDRGEGTIKVDNSELETNGFGSPIIYSTGDISVSNTKGVANGSQMVVVEGKNSASVIDSTFRASGRGNRNNVDNAGVMIYQSMSGDASSGTGMFTSKNSTLSIDSSSEFYESAPMFFITNTDAVINLENTELEYGSGILVSMKGTSEWGNSGSNGGNLTFNANNQKLDGDIVLDNISTMFFSLTNCSYSGEINSDNLAKEFNLKLDSSSKITLTGDSYVSSLEDADSTYSNINFNGYKLYVNGKAIN